jgi:hypothetical protein
MQRILDLFTRRVSGSSFQVKRLSRGRGRW